MGIPGTYASGSRVSLWACDAQLSIWQQPSIALHRLIVFIAAPSTIPGHRSDARLGLSQIFLDGVNAQAELSGDLFIGETVALVGE
jgi:hypothetical protein